MASIGRLVTRLLLGVITIIGLSMLIFLISRVMPGDPARAMLGEYAIQEQVQKLRKELGLDRPLYEQYYMFLKGLSKGELGISLITKRDVTKDLIQRFPATFELVAVAMCFALTIGIPLGIISALHKNRLPDHACRLVAFAGVSLPRYWIGIMLQLALGYYLKLLPLTGRISGIPPTHVTGLFLVDSLLTLKLRAFTDSLMHILLPAITLALATLAQVARLLRANMLDQEEKDYTLVMRLMGIPKLLIISKYMFKNAFSSALTIIGVSFGYLIGTAFIVETVFNWPGMARYGVNAVLRKDFNAVVGVVVVVGLGYLLISFIVDLLYEYLDPRIRLKR